MADENVGSSLAGFVESLSFPRLLGTDGEKKAQELIMETLGEIGVEFSDEPVPWSTAPWMLVLPLMCTLGIGSSFFTLYLMKFLPQWTFVGLLALVATVGGFGYALASGKAYFWGADQNAPSKNFVARIPPKSGRAERMVVYSSHYDTKSQSVPAGWRVAFIMFAGLGLLGFFACALVVQVAALVGSAGNAFTSGAFSAGIVFLAVLTFGAAGTASVRLGNRSPGTIDNATGVGVCVGLAKHFASNPLERVEVQVAMFTGEELGLYGARAYVAAHLAELREKKAVCLNYDGIKAPLRYLARLGSMRMDAPAYKPFFDALLDASSEAGVPLQKVSIPFGVWTDSIPFVKVGIPSTTIISLLGANYVHTSGDNVDKLDAGSLAQAVDLGAKFGEQVDRSCG
ncbi:MAG: M28 family metallopeptidase [Promethearchaeota archaeon]